MLGPNHPTILITKTSYAATLLHLQKFKESETVLKQVTLQCEEVFGRHHQDTLNAQLDYAVALRYLHKFNESEKIL